jgi:predicted O-methyltransferase YrrM
MQLMNAKVVLDSVSSPQNALRMLFRLVRSQRPEWAVEVGSAFGIGSIAIVSAMSTLLTTHFDGFEFENWLAKIADEGISKILVQHDRIHPGPLEKTFQGVATGSSVVDFAFVDAMHILEETKGYHEMLLPHSPTSTVIVYDDINWSDGMKDFWKSLAEDKRLSDVISAGARWGIVRIA